MLETTSMHSTPPTVQPSTCRYYKRSCLSLPHWPATPAYLLSLCAQHRGICLNRGSQIIPTNFYSWVTTRLEHVTADCVGIRPPCFGDRTVKRLQNAKYLPHRVGVPLRYPNYARDIRNIAGKPISILRLMHHYRVQGVKKYSLWSPYPVMLKLWEFQEIWQSPNRSCLFFIRPYRHCFVCVVDTRYEHNNISKDEPLRCIVRQNYL